MNTSPMLHRDTAPRELWNRCDECGRFIALEDFDKGAFRHLDTPDSDRSREEWTTLCIKHSYLAHPLYKWQPK